ncbi:hypothetical protein FSARC_7892 [Fusarium sarcochroum]|uniref:PNPLA domain-containing protein n=1 Tax=Fusarium sarcochroum TaxID=1208366 RepID=A0A8H4TUE8_9HYPO|nr:hypothetical protein FSARC_7892 [Fusarium sarcochroum]
MSRPDNDSVISFTTDLEPKDESEIAALQAFTQSHVDAGSSDGEESTSASTYVSWREPSHDFVRTQARNLKISSSCHICDRPGRPEELIFCSGCEAPRRPAHRKCLAELRAHVPRRVRRRSSIGDEDCEEVGYIDYVFTRYLLRSPTPESRPELHVNDTTCAWIGVPVLQEADKPQIHVWSRLQDLLQMSRKTRRRQYPNLVSFIGDTGSGKSTLIRAMIQMARPESPGDESVPVPGLPEDRFVSTSSDIHAYADPLTLSSRSPMVYVDCEGLVGSDEPVSQEIVEQLYEPGWYFEYVVCFVTTNGRSSNNFLDKLIGWAQESHDRILNQQMKPALIIIIINKDVEADFYESSPSDPTEDLLRSFQKTERFKSLQALWEEREHSIKETADLLRCYYSDFKVVLIPAITRKSSPAEATSVSKSIRQLYETVKTSVAKVCCNKAKDGTESDLAKLNTHLNRSLLVLGQDHRAALDLHDIGKGDSPIPTKLSDHMASTLQQMSTSRNLDTTNEIGGEQVLVNSFTPYVSACIVAQTSEIEDTELRKATNDKLVSEAQSGLQKFRWRHWRCEALDVQGKRRCQNYFDGHDKGHQFKSRSGSAAKSLNNQGDISGDRCTWYPDEFARRLREEIARLQKNGQAMQTLTSLAREIRLTELQSQRTCFTFEHGICQTCLERFARQTNGGSILVIEKCPLGCALETGTWSVRIKPKTAAPRVLALDGGGVRGIVELYILSQIEKQIGHGMLIHELFDFVLTPKGGIVALGVFHERCSAHDAILKFQSLAKQAFTLNLGLGNYFIKSMVQPFYDIRYKNDGIENALKQCFGRSSISCVLEDYLSREDDQWKDFRIWEAARATSAAPVLFQPFVHKRTQRSYVDGALAYDNPVSLAFSEVDKIWPQSLPSDIILSIGTGAVVDPKSGKMKRKRDSRLEGLTRLLPRSYRKQLEAGLGIIQGSMNCHEA